MEPHEDTKKKVDSDDGGKKKKKEPKKSKKDDGPDETNDVTPEVKDKKKTKSKKEKAEVTPLDASKSPKPKKLKKLSSSEHEAKDDKLTEKKKKDDKEPTVDEVGDGEAASAPSKAKKKKNTVVEASVVSDDDIQPKDTEGNVDGETTLKDDSPNAQPKMGKRKSKKNLMAESSDDELELKSDHLKKKKGKKPEATAVDEEGETKAKVKKGKKNLLPDSELEGEARQKSKKKHKVSELSGEKVESTKKKKKKRSPANSQVPASLTGSATMESSAQSNKTPMFSLPAPAKALDDSTKEVSSEDNATNAIENSQQTLLVPQSESTKSEDAADKTVVLHPLESRPTANENVPGDLPGIIESETTDENQVFISDNEKSPDQVIGESNNTKNANDDPNLPEGGERYELQNSNNPSEEPSVDIVIGEGHTDSIVSHDKSAMDDNVEVAETPTIVCEETEANANSASNLVEGSLETDNALPTIVAAIAGGTTTGMEVSDVLSDGISSLIPESGHPPVDHVVESTSEGSAHVEVVEAPTIVCEETESNANSASNVVEGSLETDNALPTIVQASTRGNTNGMEVGEVLSDGIPLLVPESGHPPVADVLETTGDGSVLTTSNEVKELQPHDELEGGIRLASTKMTTPTESENLEETYNHLESHEEPNIQGIAQHTSQNVETLDNESARDETNATEVATDGSSEDAQENHLDSKGIVDVLDTTTGDLSKSLGDNATEAKEVVSDVLDQDNVPSNVEVAVADVQETQSGDSAKAEESLVKANIGEVTEQIVDTTEIKKKDDLIPTLVAPSVDINEVTSSPEIPKELLAVCDAMAGLVKEDESTSKEMHRLKEQLLILVGAMHDEKISLHARLQKQEAELLKSEEKIGMLEDEIEKQLADWDVLEVKLGQADLEISKLLAENQRLGNELEMTSKADLNGDPSEFSPVNVPLKNFSEEIATAKSELEEP